MARQRPTRAPHVEIDRIVIRKVPYQLEVNRCRNEEIIVRQFWVGVAYYWRGAPGLVKGPYIAEIDRIVIRDVQYQLEVNRCRNKEIIVKDNLGWVWPIKVIGNTINSMHAVLIMKQILL
ncbi:hypothetical protein DPMN_030427 [Dreissena polymorpha]|uniref:Uncharacterized protein n=1 Tax=Dreissena polymorpha TaxID=45954 RepID=A0A9D4RG57_DREPO|nr:hypothetical protein DPMN_030427 [Dreissena polymorpha]